MPLTPSTRMGPYEILSALGAGGMREEYRARDSRLGRDVAIKILPTHLASKSDARRFEREAKTISSLNHPHICALYDVGNQDGIEFLVMEYVEGETLCPAARVAMAAALGNETIPVWILAPAQQGSKPGSTVWVGAKER